MSKSAVILINPKYPHNVGQVLRACACYAVDALATVGTRVSLEGDGKNYRLPREERLRDYSHVKLFNSYKPLLELPGLTPVAVEVRPESENLIDFIHPTNAAYVFGPEDGGLDRSILTACQRFVEIPTIHCLNLSIAVATVLYDRELKMQRYRNQCS